MKFLDNNSFHRLKSVVALVAMLAAPIVAAAQPKKSDLANPVVQVMLIIMVMLLLGVAILANVVKGAAQLNANKRKDESQKQAGRVVSALLVLSFLMAGTTDSVAQTAAPAAVASTVNGVSATVFYLMSGVILVEILVLIMLAAQLRSLIGVEVKRVTKKVVTVAAADAAPKLSLWWRINNAYAMEKEKDIDLEHDYDGIRELDNSVPPWWQFGFVASILFGVVYLWVYHVGETAPLQTEELELAINKAEIQKAAYLKKSANNVDENTVAMLDASAIAAGQGLFTQNCVACHGAQGQGAAVGPNLADDYWIHGGDLKSIFKTIKYGVVEKGMRAWKEDMSPVQMAQLSSYVKSLKGTNPPAAKEPQGELYTESAVTDSTSTVPKP